MKLTPLLASLSLAALGSPLFAAPPDKLSLHPHEHIAIVGNTLADRLQHDGTLEAFIVKSHPQMDIGIRNLGFATDEVNLHRRADGVPTMDEWLTKVHADAVLAFWGFNESFAGPAGVEKFKGELDRYLKDLKAAKYNGQSAPQVVLFSPIAQEKGTDPNWPDPTANNANLKLYTAAMAEVAQANGVPFVDLFEPSLELYRAAKVPLTHNGIHLTVAGYQALAPVIYRALFAQTPPPEDAELEKIRAAVQVENEMWLSRYRTVDQFNIFGGRSTIGYESGKGGPKVDNRAVLWPEMAQRDVMTENREKRVWALAQGHDVPVDDSNLPEVPKIKSNDPGPNPDGSYVYLDPEVAIQHMTVPKGVKVELVASEKQFPELVSPVQMAWDTKGRLWISSWKNYPERTPTSTDGDKLLVLDIGPDGKATKCTTYLDGLNCPTGFQFYKDSVFVVESPYMWQVKDTDGDGKADWKERVLDGLDAADSHHETNAMAISPGGAYFPSDGVFFRSQIETAWGPTRNTNGGIYRWEPRTGRFERYVAYNFANPHGKVFDYWGNDIDTDATGNESFFTPAFSGHLDESLGKHPQMNQFWTRPSRPCPGTAILSSRAWPAEYQNNFLDCNVISVQGIFRAKITEEGSGLKGETLENLISSDDPNFRPSGVSVAPDGSLYIMDWHKPLIGHLQHHLRDPNREQDHGRIYRLTYEGMPLLKPALIAGQPIPALLELLKTPENNVRDRAKLELGGRPTPEVMAAVDRWVAGLDRKDPAFEHNLLEALWVKQYHNVVDEALLKRVLSSPEPRARAQGVRVVCYQRDRLPQALAYLKTAATDESPRVRLEAVRAASFFTQWEAADIALSSLRLPSDYYLGYCLKETMRQLEPWWKAALTAGQPLAEGNPAGLKFLVGNISTQELAKLPKSPLVYTALLTRADVPAADRQAALISLAAERKAKPTEIILETVADSGLASRAADALSHLLLTQPAADLHAQLAAIRHLESDSKIADTTRTALTAAVLVAQNSLTEALSAAKTPDEVTALLRAIPLIPDPTLRATAFAPVLAMVKKLPDALRAQMTEGGTKARYVLISLPGQATLTLAEVEVMSDGKNIAPSGRAHQSSTAFGGDASRAIDGNTSGTFGDQGQSHTKEHQTNTWWELDLGSEHPIDAVKIWNRTDGDGAYVKRLDHFTLTLLDGKHEEVASVKDQPAPAVNVEIPMKGDPIGAVRRAAIAALVSTNQQPAEVFSTLAGLIAEGEEVPAAAAALRTVPRSAWKASLAGPALQKIIAWAGTTPVDRRTAQPFVETMQLAGGLAGLLPAEQAAATRKQLRGLGVSVYVIKTVREQMRYDTPRLVVEAGKPFEIIFENNDMMQHNLVVVQPGTRQAVAVEVQTMKPDQLDREGRAYMPGDGKKLDPRVLAATKLTDPGKKQTLQLTAPQKEGDYEYVCTFPGHWLLMFGELVVTKDVDAYLQAHPQAALPAPGTVVPAVAAPLPGVPPPVAPKVPAPVGKPLTYEGTAGPLQGRQIVFIASDVEYKSEEALPEIARLLAKHFGAKCTVLFGLDPETGEIKPGESYIPGTEALKTADLLFIFTRFQNLPAAQMQPIVDYLDRGGPVIGLRTATHAFKIPKESPFAKYDFQFKDGSFQNGFGRQVLGETWVGHYAPNHQSSTRLEIAPGAAAHPILTGVKDMWAQVGAYNAHPIEGSEVLALAQPLAGMTAQSPVDETRKPMPGAWVRTYRGKAGQTGRVFATTYGASGDLTNEGFRRMVVNAVFWTLGAESAIKPNLDISLVGAYRPTWLGGVKRSGHVKPQDLAGWDSPIWPE